MNKILVVGSLNMDMVVNAPYIPKVGETIIGSNFQTNPGGKGSNQAVAISKLGGHVKMLGCVGKDEMGQTLIDSLEKAGVDASSVTKIEDQVSGIAVITVDDLGANNIVVVQGANRFCSPEYIETNRKIIEACDVIVMQMEIPNETITHCIKLANQFNKIIVLNPAPANLIHEELFPMIDYLIPNETELEIISGKKLNSREDIINAGKELLDKGVKNLVVTLGEKGALFLNREGQLLIPAQPVKAIDTTAAGDSFIAAFIVALTEGKEVQEALQFATKVAAIVVCRKGAIASIPTKDELQFEQ